MTLPTGCRSKWRLICLFLLIPLNSAQFFDNTDQAYNKYHPAQFNDPIRRALGLWSRLLNRMSQPNEPTDDQLHLRVGEDGARSAFDDLELPNIFGNLNQRRDKNARLPLAQPREGFALSGPNSIIDEGILNQLLPRTRGEQVKNKEEVRGLEETVKPAESPINNNSKPTETPTEPSKIQPQTHDDFKHHEKASKSTKNPRTSTKKPAKINKNSPEDEEYSSVSDETSSQLDDRSQLDENWEDSVDESLTERKNEEKSDKNRKTEPKLSKNQENSTETDDEATKHSKSHQRSIKKSSKNEDPSSNSTKTPTSTTTVFPSSTNEHPSRTGAKRARKPQKIDDQSLEQSTHKKDQRRKEKLNTSSAESESTEKEEQKREKGKFGVTAEPENGKEEEKRVTKGPSSTKIQKTKLKAMVRVTAAHNTPTTTQHRPTPTTDPTTRSPKVTFKSKKLDSSQQDSDLLTLKAHSSFLELQSSGWEPEGEEQASEGNVNPSEKTEISREESKEDSTLSQEQPPLEETTQQPPTTPKTKPPTTPKPKPSTTPRTRSTTQRLKVTVSTKKPTTLATTTETAAETTKAKWEKQRIRQGEKLSEEDIPEAEEAEFQTDDQPQTTTTAVDHTSIEVKRKKQAKSTDSIEEETQENERKLEKMMTPVSSIIDGIGPLILPLLGYSRQTVAGILNPAAAAIAAQPARAAGTRTFRPQQVSSNAQIVRATQRQPLDTLTPFQQVVAPFQRRPGNGDVAFKQEGVRKAYGNGQAHVKNHIVEPVQLPPASYYNSRQSSPDQSDFSTSNPQSIEPSVSQVGREPTFNRMVNAETTENAYGQGFVPDSATNLNEIDQATLLEVYKQILAKRGLRGASLRGVNEDQLAQIAHLAAKIPPRQQTPQVSINPANAKAVPEIRRQPSEDDPGYQMGRSNVVSSFYEDSGLMVGTQPEPQTSVSRVPSPPLGNSIGSGGGGFGGGRRPDSSFEQAALATVDDERSFF